MTDDASLTDFAGGDAADDAEAEESAADEPADSEPEPEPTETPTFTYTSTPDGAACAACGDTVETRWRAGEGGAAESPDLEQDALVCPDCKQW